MRIPNKFLDEFKNSAELKVACVIYSLITTRTKRNLMGYELLVKQETLCRYCDLSLPTIKKAIGELSAKGFIRSMQRSTYGTRKGTYIYSVKQYDLSKDYFLSDRVFFRRLNGQVFRVYMYFCRFAAGEDRSFYHSYNDISAKLGIGRREVVKAVSRLDELGLIFIRRKLTQEGDYTDNTYIVYRYKRGHLKKRYKGKRLTTSGNVISPRSLFFAKINNLFLSYILPQNNDFVKGLKCGVDDYFCYKGGGG